jgi:omega-6 fatty acid desaturase (delta-12 desaturase)
MPHAVQSKAALFEPSKKTTFSTEYEENGCLVVPNRLPTDSPPFTKADLLAAIPPHCLVRSTWRSFAHTAVDLCIVATLYYLSTFIGHASLPWWAGFVLWPVYWVCQGCVCTGLWVIAHECGHRAFSDNVLLGDVVGLILHSSLLVPYHSWRLSHAKHHRSTNDMQRDEVFVPVTRSEMHDIPGLLSGPTRVFNIAVMLLIGWPAYLFTNVTGHKYSKQTNHFNPYSPLFLKEQFWAVVVSDAALVAVVGVLFYLTTVMGSIWVMAVYGMPYLIVNLWLVLITDLQHTDPAIPHYRDEDWTWMKGALCTIDRDYGILNHVFHHITDTHVAHHLFSTMPHYHAMEATKALIPVLGKYYTYDTAAPGLTGIAQTLWKTSQYCQFVEDVGGVLWFKFK